MVALDVDTIPGLASIHPSGMGVVNSLMKYVKSNAFCRNRKDAALAVGVAACEERNHAGCAFTGYVLNVDCEMSNDAYQWHSVFHTGFTV